MLTSPCYPTLQETKQLKALVRNIVDPSRNLGHIDRALAQMAEAMSVSEQRPASTTAKTPSAKMMKNKEDCGTICEDCQ